MGQLYALPLENGTIAITELIADVRIEDEAKRMALPSPVILEGITPITEEEAAAIRAQRPKPEIQASSSSVSQVNIQAIEIIQEENAAIRVELETLRRTIANLPHWLADQISRGNVKADGQ